MKQLLCLLSVLFPLTLFGQAVSRTELRNTNTLIDARIAARTNIVMTNLQASINGVTNLLKLGHYNVYSNVFGISISPGDANTSVKFHTLRTNVAAVGGGTIEFNTGAYQITNWPVIHNGANPPRQPPLRITGQGSWMSGQGTIIINGGTTLELPGTNAIAKIDTRGLGRLEIDHLTLSNTNGPTANGTPFIQSTLTMLHIHHVGFLGRNSADAANEDAIVLGGTNTTFTGASDDCFQGYGTVIENNFFNNIRRVGLLRTYANGTVWRDNTVWTQCGGDTVFEIIGDHNNTSTGNFFIGNLIELPSYTNMARLVRAQKNSFVYNNLFDPIPGTTASQLILSNAPYNNLVEGYVDGTYAGVRDLDGTSAALTAVNTHGQGKTNWSHNYYQFENPIRINDQVGFWHTFGTNSIYDQILSGSEYVLYWQGTGMTAEPLVSFHRTSDTTKILDIRGTGQSILRSQDSYMRIQSAAGQPLFLGDMSGQDWYILNGSLFTTKVGETLKLANGSKVTWSETSNPAGQIGLSIVYTNGYWRIIAETAAGVGTNMFMVNTNGEVFMPHVGTNASPVAAAVFDATGKIQRGALSSGGSGTPNGPIGAIQFAGLVSDFRGTNSLLWTNDTLILNQPDTTASRYFYFANGSLTTPTFSIQYTTNIWKWQSDFGSSGPNFVQGQKDNRSLTFGFGGLLNTITNDANVYNKSNSVTSGSVTAASLVATAGTSNELGSTWFSGVDYFTTLTPDLPLILVGNRVTNAPTGFQPTNANLTAWGNLSTNSLTATVASVMTQTNWVLDQIYTNDTGAAIVVNAATFFAAAAVNGNVAVELMFSPAGGANWTKLSSFSLSTLLTGLTMTGTNSVVGVVTNTGSFYFTNASSGAGNSAGLVAGSGQFTKLGGGTVFTNDGSGLTVSVAAASVITANRSAASVLIQTNRMTAAQTLVHTNFNTGQFGTEVIPGEAAGGTARILTYAVVAGSLIRTNDSAFIASSGFGISVPAGYALEISSMQKSFLSTNVVDLKIAYQPQ